MTKYIVKPMEVITCRKDHPAFIAPFGIKTSKRLETAEAIIANNHLVTLDTTLMWANHEPACSVCGHFIFNVLRQNVIGLYIRGKFRDCGHQIFLKPDPTS